MSRCSETAWKAFQRISKSLPPELQSPQSDLVVPRIYSESFWGANMSISLILYLACIGLNPIQEEDVRNHFERKAARRSYRGQWNLVHQLVHEETFAPIVLIQIVLDSEGPHAFFGNRVNSIIRAGTILRWDPIRTTEGSRAKPKQRKRGYDDKGTLGKMKVEPPERDRGLPPETYTSSHTLFFSRFPQYLRKSRLLQRKLGIDPTLQLEKEKYKKCTELCEIFLEDIRQLRRMPYPEDRKSRRRLRKRCRLIIRRQDEVVRLYCELRSSSAEKVPEGPSSAEVGGSHSRVGYTLPEAFWTSRQVLAELVEYFGFSDLGIPPIDR